MKTTIIKTITVILPALSIMFFTRCADNSTKEKDPVEKAEDRNDAKFNKVAEKDAQALVDAYTGSLYELKVAETAKIKATSQEAKDLAVTMVDGHTGLNEQMRTLAAKKQISLPADLSPEQSDKVVEMNEEKGIKYDKDFASLMVDNHKDAIDIYGKYSMDCTDAEIKSWFAATVPALQNHLDMAMTSKEKIDKMK